MAKTISVKILKIHYSGDSIGNDIQIETEISGQLFVFKQRIKRGTTFELNQEIAQLLAENYILEVPIRIKFTEKDLVFNDEGETSGVIRIDSTKTEPQIFSFEIKVREKNKVIGKSTAVFTVILLADFSQSNLKQYKSPKSGQNYNQYDLAIENAVKYWNNEFSKQTNPPVILLDPNLVKAMIYVESKMGYYVPSDSYIKKNPNYYRSYPDVMQAGDPRNGSLFVLKNIQNPKIGKKATEFEIIDGEEVIIEYPEANSDTPEQSIHWGVRWLFRKARENIKQADGIWARRWLDWKEAIRKYNVGDPGYVEKVYKVYEQGLGERKFKLWQLGGLIIFLLSIGSFIDYDKLDDPFLDFYDASAMVISASKRVENYDDWISINNLRDKILNSFSKEDRDEIEDVEIDRPYDSPLFVAIIENEKDWWEYFEIGKVENGKIKWLEMKNWPEGEYMENSILSARWIELKGFKQPMLEVYGTTHMGNGKIYLFEIDNEEYSLTFHTFAVESGEKLSSDYSDLDGDGFSDVTLLKYPDKFVYLWNNNIKKWEEKTH